MFSLPTKALSIVALAALVPTGAQAQSNSVLMLLPTDGRVLEIGEEAAGALSTADYTSVDDYLLEAWELEGRAGGTVTIDMESDAFDARLYLVGPGVAETLWDDDSGGGCNARLNFTFLENGTFRVVASSLGFRETGTYRLRVSEQAGPAPSYGCGEMNPEVLSSLPTEGRSLELGTLAAGVLAPNSRIVQDGRPGEAWELSGQEGDRLSIILESDDFDAYLYVAGPGLPEILSDDDGAGDLNSLIEVTLRSDEPYTVVASALGSGDFGAYTIRVEEAADLNALPIDGRIVDLGQTVDGTLLFADPVVLDGRRGQAWGFDATAGQRVVIDLRSDDFDSYLYLVGPGLMEPLSDDDGGDGTNSQITVTFPETGTYRIIASPYGSDDSGAFTLSVRSDEAVDLNTLSIDFRNIDIGQTVQSALFVSDPVLIDDRRGQAWGLEGTAGQSVVIDLRSDEFDTFLYVVGPGLAEPMRNDDGGDDTNSQLTVTFPETGTYRIIASPWGSSTESGAYSLSVSPR